MSDAECQLRAGAADAVSGAMADLAAGMRRRLREARTRGYGCINRPVSGAASVYVISPDGTLLQAWISGRSDGATVVLVPGWGEEARLFREVGRELIARGFRVVSFDLRGQGDSSAPAGDDQSLARYGEDIEAVLLATCDGRRDVLIAGHSMGATAIAEWSSNHDVESRVAGAALINAGPLEVSASSPLAPTVVASYAAVRTPAEQEHEISVGLRDDPVSRAAIRDTAFGSRATGEHLRFYVPMLARCAPMVRVRAGEAITGVDPTRSLSGLVVPTLVLAGAEDRITPVEQSRLIADALPNLDRLTVLRKVGHIAPLEAPDLVAMQLANATRRAVCGLRTLRARGPQRHPGHHSLN